VIAEVTFHGYLFAFMILHRPKGAGLETGFTTDAQIFLYPHDAIGITDNGRIRTGLGTEWSGTMVTINGKITRGLFHYPDQPGYHL